MSTVRGTTLGLLAGACALALAGAAEAAVVLEDHFDYVDSAALRSAWNSTGAALGGGTYTPTMRLDTGWTSTGSFPQMTTPVQAGVFNNIHGYRSLSSTLSEDFTLDVKWIQTNFQRNGRILLTDSGGRQGYMLMWTSANTSQYRAAGFFNLYKVDLAVDVVYNNSLTAPAMTKLGGDMSNHSSAGVVYHPVVGVDVTTDTVAKTVTVGAIHDPLMAEVSLSWVKDTGTFTLNVNGNLLGTRTDTTFNSFDRVYLTGNTSSVYDDLSISTVPEPAMLAPLAIGAVALMRRRSAAAK